MNRLIICDDEAILRNGLKSLIEKSNLPVEIVALAANGNEALEVIQKYKPHIVLMDINMPGISGLSVIEQCSQNGVNPIFIIISGHDEFEYAQKACRLNVMDYLLKPINKAHLISLIEEAVEKIKKEQLTQHIFIRQPETTAQQIIKYVQENFDDSELSLNKLSRIFNLSESYITRIIKNETDSSFSNILINLRIKKSIEYLIQQPDMKLVEISEKCGFSSQHYFSRIFKEKIGFSPIDYRKNILNNK